MFRSKSLALHAVRTQSINSDSSPEGEGLVDVSTELNTCEASPSSETGPVPSALQENHKDPTKNQPDSSPDIEGQKVEVGDPREGDRLWIHLRDNMKEIKTFCAEMIKLIPIPEHCVIEGKLSNLRTIPTVPCYLTKYLTFKCSAAGQLSSTTHSTHTIGGKIDVND